MAKVAVILSDCGYLDGAEIHESVISLLLLEQKRHTYQCFTPDILQKKWSIIWVGMRKKARSAMFLRNQRELQSYSSRNCSHICDNCSCKCPWKHVFIRRWPSYMQYTNATCIYLYGTSLSSEMIRKLCKKLRGYPAKIIAVSYALKEYDAHFVTKKSWKEKFTWSRIKFFIQTSN